MSIRLKRIYESTAADDGYRVLVDRLWPRGISKEKAHIDAWLKEIAPSDGLRKWFGHDPEKWQEFSERYFRELDGHSEAVELLARKAAEGRITLLFASADREFNNAVALKDYLAAKF